MGLQFTNNDILRDGRETEVKQKGCNCWFCADFKNCLSKLIIKKKRELQKKITVLQLIDALGNMYCVTKFLFFP